MKNDHCSLSCCPKFLVDMRSSLLLLIGWIGTLVIGYAQVIQVSPPVFTAEDYVTVVFDASQGNRALADHRGAVYAHTGVITGTPNAPSDWRYVQGEWGKPDPKVRMSYLGDNRYQLRINVRRFYGLPEDVSVLRLAFVFRDRRGALIAKGEDDQDLYFPPPRVAGASEEDSLSLGGAIPLGNAVSVEPLPPDGLALSDGKQRLLLRAYGEGVVQFSYLPTDQAPDASLSVVAAATPLRYQQVDSTHYRVEVDAEHHLWLQTQPIRWELRRGSETLLDDEGGFAYEAQQPAAGLRVHLQPQEHLYGGGSRALPLDRRGYRLDLYHQPAYGYQDGQADLYLSLPYVQSSRGYALMVDSYRPGYLDLGAQQAEVAELGFATDALTCFLLVGDPPMLSQRLADLTGHQPLPPRWALGYLQSRFGYRTQRETEEIALLTREAGFRLDGLCVDAYWFGGPGRMGDLRWVGSQWPDPAGMMQRLDRLGVGVLPIIEPYVVRASDAFDSLADQGLLATDAGGEPFVIKEFWAGATGLLDLTEPQAQDWLWQRVQALIEQGAAGVWSDLVEPENHPAGMQHAAGPADAVHNSLPLVWAQVLHDRFRDAYPERRWFNLIRSGHLGMQRYGTYPWTGDVSRTWSGLQAQPKATLGLGLSGVGYLHSDLGGFTGSGEDEELYQRWLQLGVFSPIMRVHGNTEGFEPEPIFQSPATQELVRQAIALRYRLFPYLNTLAWQNHRHGWPLVRPMFFHFPADTLTYTLDEQFLLGEQLLVAPVLRPGQSSVSVYLPQGEWYDYFWEEKYEGGHWYRMPIPADHLPTFVRAGTVLPTGTLPEHLSEWKADTLFWQAWLSSAEAGELAGELWLDDGETHGVAEQEKYRRFVCQGIWDKKNVEMTWQVSGQGYQGEVVNSVQQVTLVGLSEAPRWVKVGRKKLPPEAWRWQDGQLVITFSHPPVDWSVKVRK